MNIYGANVWYAKAKADSILSSSLFLNANKPDRNLCVITFVYLKILNYVKIIFLKNMSFIIIVDSDKILF